MKISYDFAKLTDIDDIMHIEQSSFTPEECLSRASMIERIEKISHSFILARNEDGKAIGMIVGPTSDQRYITDDLFEHTPESQDTDKVQMIVSLCVLSEYAGLGIANQLIKELSEISRAKKRELISLTCLDYLIPFYEKKGFVHEGVSESKLAGETWHNMTLTL